MGEREKTIRRSECHDVRTQLVSADCEDGLWGGGLGGRSPGKPLEAHTGTGMDSPLEILAWNAGLLTS